MKRRGSSNGGRRNFETWKKIPQPSPTEKQKLDIVSHSALLSSSPGTPAGPPKQPSSLRALGRGLGRAVHQQPSRKKHAKRTLRSRGQKERKDAAELPSSPIPSWPSGERNKIPKPSNQHRSEGACPPPLPFLGEPHALLGPELHWGIRGLACKDEGCRSRGPSPPDPTCPSSLPCLWLLPSTALDRVRRVASESPCPTLGLEAPLAVGRGLPLELVSCSRNGGCSAAPS